jgi:nucleoside-diphosphate-sugar epimerase
VPTDAPAAARRSVKAMVAAGRASDYFGPRGGAQSNLGNRVFPAALTGATATVLGDPDQPHTYTDIPDIGAGLAVLGEHSDAPGRAWHLPNDPAARTTRQLVEAVHQQAGRPRARLRRVHPLLLQVAALTNPTVRELLEMQHQFEEPFIVDSSRIATHLGVRATRWTRPWRTRWRCTAALTLSRAAVPDHEAGHADRLKVAAAVVFDSAGVVTRQYQERRWC